MADTERLEWRRSSRCDSNTCIEVASIAGKVVLRDGKEPDGERLLVSVQEWRSFVAWVRRCG